MAAQAQAQIAKGVLAHSDWVNTNKGGENVAWGSIFPTFTSAIKSWHDEKIYFNFDAGKGKTQNHVIKNFIQLVWKGASKIGCARGSLYGKPWYIVHYDNSPKIHRPDAVKENVGLPKEVNIASAVCYFDPGSGGIRDGWGFLRNFYIADLVPQIATAASVHTLTAKKQFIVHTN